MFGLPNTPESPAASDPAFRGPSFAAVSISPPVASAKILGHRCRSLDPSLVLRPREPCPHSRPSQPFTLLPEEYKGRTLPRLRGSVTRCSYRIHDRLHLCHNLGAIFIDASLLYNFAHQGDVA